MRMLLMLGTYLACIGAAAGCNASVSPEGVRLLRDSDVAYRRGDDAEAIASATRFLELHPRLQESGEAYYIRALARKRTGRTGEAKSDLQAALGLAKRPDLLVRVHHASGELAYASGDLPAAEGHYREVVELNPAAAPPSDQALYRLGCVLQRQGRWAEADSYFTRLTHLFDGSALARRAEDRIRAKQWSIQVGAFANTAAASRLERQLIARGLPARTDIDTRDKKLLRFVRIGSYATYKAAEAHLQRARTISSDAFITPAR